MRLFIGIELSDFIKKNLTQEVKLFKTPSKGWELSHDYHITLLFIGKVEPNRLPEICEKMQQIKLPAFFLETTGYQFFNRRILYLGIKQSPSLELLRYQITSLFSSWATLETKDFIPHVTIKRWQRYEFKVLKSNLDRIQFKPHSIEVDHLALFESKKDENNYKYHVIYRSQLQGILD